MLIGLEDFQVQVWSMIMVTSGLGTQGEDIDKQIHGEGKMRGWEWCGVLFYQQF